MRAAQGVKGGMDLSEGGGVKLEERMINGVEVGRGGGELEGNT